MPTGIKRKSIGRQIPEACIEFSPISTVIRRAEDPAARTSPHEDLPIGIDRNGLDKRIRQAIIDLSPTAAQIG